MVFFVRCVAFGKMVGMVYVAFLLVEVGGLFVLSRVFERGLSGLFLKITRSQGGAAWLMAVLFLPGTFLHELSHLVMARLLLVPAGHFSLWPRVEPDRVVMGSVRIAETDQLRRLIIGIAPGIVGVALILTALWFAESRGLWRIWPWRVGVVYLVFEIGNTLFSSRADLEGAWVLFVMVAVLLGLLYWVGFRLSLNEVASLVNHYRSALAQAAWLLWIPLAIDAVGIGVVGALRRAL